MFEGLSEFPLKSSKVNKEVEKPPTEEAPSFIRLKKIHQFNLFSNIWQFFLRFFFMLSVSYERFDELDISRKGIVGDRKTHFTSEQSQDWDR